MDYYTSRHVARKNYRCDASGSIREYCAAAGMVVPALFLRLYIQKGEPYIRTTIFDNGSVYTWRSTEAADLFCREYNVYEDNI